MKTAKALLRWLFGTLVRFHSATNIHSGGQLDKNHYRPPPPEYDP